MENKVEPQALTMQEFLDDMIKVEKAASNFLKKTESNECTYSKGYITQTLYGCRTCNKKAGFCLGCYINCHADHETFEIGLKRNFRCDCGTSAFEDHPCSLDQGNREDNTQNAYDHNFEGKWCICDEPYDPNIFMIRCLNCLEYYHINHLGISEDQQEKIEDSENVTSMICKTCLVSKFKFLKCYPSNLICCDKEEIAQDKPATMEPPKEESTENITLGKRSRDQEEKCKIEEKLADLTTIEELPIFLKDNWRNFLCLCEQCQTMYKDNGVYDIVTKDEDENEPEVEVADEPEKVDSQDNHSIASTVAPEENTLYGAAMKEMNKLDYFTQSNIAVLYREFYEEFKDYLDRFKDQNVVITDKHVHEFFEQLKEKKGIN